MILIGADPITRFLNEASERPFSFKDHWDCLMWLSERVRQARGVDPGATWRSRYRSLSGAIRLVREAGGMVAHMERCLVPFGIKRTAAPKRGDIAVVRFGEGGPFDGQIGAIVLEGSVALLTDQGVSIVRLGQATIEASWSV